MVSHPLELLPATGHITEMLDVRMPPTWMIAIQVSVGNNAGSHGQTLERKWDRRTQEWPFDW